MYRELVCHVCLFSEWRLCTCLRSLCFPVVNGHLGPAANPRCAIQPNSRARLFHHLHRPVRRPVRRPALMHRTRWAFLLRSYASRMRVRYPGCRVYCRQAGRLVRWPRTQRAAHRPRAALCHSWMWRWMCRVSDSHRRMLLCLGLFWQWN